MKEGIGIILLLAGTLGQAQHPEIKIHVLARSYGDSICLRWAPDSYAGWNAGNRSGYRIERYTIMQDGKLLPKPLKEILTTTPMKPYSLEKWETRTCEDSYAAIAAQALYGKTNRQTGSIITQIKEITEEQEQRFSLAMLAADMSPLAARALALFYTDRNVQRGDKYLYRVFIDSAPDEMASDTGYIYTGPDEILPLPKPLPPEAFCYNGRILIHWKTELFRQIYTAWFAERSSDSSGPYHRINQEAVTSFSSAENDGHSILFPDTLPVNSGTFFYRILGINPFGEIGPPSSPVKVLPCSSRSELPVISSARVQGDTIVILNWMHAVQDSPTEIKIWRSSFESKNYTCIAQVPASDTIFADSIPSGTNYYKISVKMSDGDVRFSMPVLVQLPDTVPPSPPKGLQGSADTSGVITLVWKHNQEPDIYGYRIYRGNNPGEEFSQITVRPVFDTIYYDTIEANTLSRKVYYRLMALDNRQNYSALSEIIEIVKPDRIPPPPPVVYTISGDFDGIYLAFSGKTSEDTKEACIFISSPGDTSFTLKKVIPATADTLVWTDTSAIPGVVYNYYIILTDSAGNKSPASGIISMVRNSLPAAFSPVLKYRKGKSKQLVVLSWNKIPGNIKRIVIFRAEPNETFQAYASVAGDATTFTDQQTQTKKKYRYVIQAVSQTGTLSKPSNPVEVAL